MEVHKYFLLKNAVPSNKEVQKYFRWKYLAEQNILNLKRNLKKVKNMSWRKRIEKSGFFRDTLPKKEEEKKESKSETALFSIGQN